MYIVISTADGDVQYCRGGQTCTDDCCRRTSFNQRTTHQV